MLRDRKSTGASTLSDFDDMKQTTDISASKVVIVLTRAHRSLLDYFQAGLALQGISVTDFVILEALLHKGALPLAVIASKTLRLPTAAMSPAVERLSLRGLIRRQKNRNGRTAEVFELTEEGRRYITKIYDAHEKDIGTVMGILSSKERKQLWRVLKRIGLQGDRCQHLRLRDRRGGLAPRQLRRVTEYMTEHVADPVRLRDLAAQTGLSGSQFGRAFKVSMGISPHQWQMNQRILEAQELLKQAKFSLAEISHKTGFAEQSHFQRVFKRIVGLSPGLWQREHRL
jgi:AraC-like DNA-binding protein/DNA-binding MarR family transcriptional regulator